MDIISSLATSNYIVVNKDLIKLLGIKEAIIIGELCSEYLYWQNQNKLEDDWFYSTVKNIETNTGLSGHEQRLIIKHLEELNIIITEKRGMPAKRYIKIDQCQLLKILTTSDSKFEGQVIKNFNLNNNNNNNKITNNINIISNSKKSISKSIISSKSSKKENYNNCIILVDNLFNDEEVKTKLKEYLVIRFKKGLEVGQWKKIIEELRIIAKTKTECLEIINNSYLSNWNKFYPLKQEYKTKTIDNTSNYKSTKSDNLNLVLDDNGKPLQF